MKIGDYIQISDAKNVSLNGKKGYIIDVTKNSLVLLEHEEAGSYESILMSLTKEEYEKKIRILKGQIK